VHSGFEALAFLVGGLLYYRLKKRDTLTEKERPWVVLTGCIGAALGCKIFFWLENPQWFINHLTDCVALAAGKSLVGALVGGWLGVETAKAVLGVKSTTGDTFVVPLIVGIIIGRIGCFLTGFYDQTYGVPTNLPWAIDFGDGVLRHPTQLYEIIWLVLLLSALCWRAKCCPYTQGDLFKLFMLGYMGFRFLEEFLKPVTHAYGGLDIEQIAAILVYLYYLPFLFSGFIRKPEGEAKT
jgi:phosphatidylglycerol---prolipoprotein diacylglyceryl transferase